jgi:DNA-binding GntR family transcriptional regulator
VAERNTPDLAITLDRYSPVPLWHQIATRLEGAIASGELQRGDHLENELDLCERWQVSRPTVRKAIQTMVERGLMLRRRGIGTVVISNSAHRPTRLADLHDDLTGQGRTPSTRLLSIETITPDPDIAQALWLTGRSRVLHMERIRFADDRPLALMRNWVVTDLGDGIDTDRLATDSLYAVLRSAGIQPYRARQRIGAVAADRELAKLLDVAVGAPLITVHRVMSDDTGRPIEVGEHHIAAERHSMEMTLIET